MDFHKYAADEASALINRLLEESSATSTQQVLKFKLALTTALYALESSVGARPETETHIAEFVERLSEASSKATAGTVQQVIDEARTAAEALRAELDDKTARLEDQTARLEEQTARLDEYAAKEETLEASLRTSQDHAETLEAELAEERARTDSVRVEMNDALEAHAKELADARDAHAKMEAAWDEAMEARDEEARARRSIETELREIRESLEASREEMARVSHELESAVVERSKLEDAVSLAYSQAQAAEAKLGAVTDLFKASAARVKALERAQKEHDRTIRDLEAKPQPAGGSPEAGAASLPVLDELLSSFEALAGATTIGDVLTTLTEHVAAEFPRVALFRVKSNRLEGEHQIGIEATDVTKIIIPRETNSILNAAATSRRVERRTAKGLADNGGGPFEGSPSCAIALPIVVQGETLAVVYADNEGQSPRDPAALNLRTRFAEVLSRHATALLTRLTTELKMLAELRAYAGSLLTEIEEMYLSDMSAGKDGPDLQKRLKANVEYARSIYANRAGLEGADAATLLEDQLTMLIESKDGTPFGRDLAAVARQPDQNSAAFRS
jgi:hypothetical protein